MQSFVAPLHWGKSSLHVDTLSCDEDFPQCRVSQAVRGCRRRAPDTMNRFSPTSSDNTARTRSPRGGVNQENPVEVQWLKEVFRKELGLGSYDVEGDGDCWFRAFTGSMGIITVDEAAKQTMDRQWTKLICKHRQGAVQNLLSPAYRRMCDEEFSGVPGWRRALDPFRRSGYWDWNRVAGRESTAFMAVFAKDITDALVDRDDERALPKIAVIERYSKDHHTMKGKAPLEGDFYLPCVWVYDVDPGNLVRPPSFKKPITILDFVGKLRSGEAYAIVEYNGSSHFSFWRKPPVDGDDSKATPAMAPFELKLAAVAGESDTDEALEAGADAKLFGEGSQGDDDAEQASEHLVEAAGARPSPEVERVSRTESETAEDAATEQKIDAGDPTEGAPAAAQSGSVPSTPELMRAAAANAARQAASPPLQRQTRATYPLPDFGRGGAGHNQTLLTETQEIDLVTNKVVEDFSQPPPYADAVAGIGMAPASVSAEDAANAEPADEEQVVLPAAAPRDVDVVPPTQVEQPVAAAAEVADEGKEDDDGEAGATWEDMVGRQKAIMEDIQSKQQAAGEGASEEAPVESTPETQGYAEKKVGEEEAAWRLEDAKRVVAATAAIKAEKEVMASTRLEMAVGDDESLKHGTVVRSMQDIAGKNMLVVVFDDLSYLAIGLDMLAFMCKQSKLTVLPGEYHDVAKPPKIYVHNYLKATTGKRLPFAFVKTPVLTDVFHGTREYIFYAIYEPAKPPIDPERFSPPTQEAAVWSGDIVSVPGLIVGVLSEQIVADSAVDGMVGAGDDDEPGVKCTVVVPVLLESLSNSSRLRRLSLVLMDDGQLGVIEFKALEMAELVEQGHRDPERMATSMAVTATTLVSRDPSQASLVTVIKRCTQAHSNTNATIAALGGTPIAASTRHQKREKPGAPGPSATNTASTSQDSPNLFNDGDSSPLPRPAPAAGKLPVKAVAKVPDAEPKRSSLCLGRRVGVLVGGCINL